MNELALLLAATLNAGTVLAIAGLGLLINGDMGLLRYARFGTSRLKLATIPGVVGLALRGEVFTNRRHDQRHARLTSTFHNHERKFPVSSDQPELHLVTPRLELSMKRKRSETSAESLISSLMRSTA